MATIGLFTDLDILKKFFWNYSQEDIEELCKDYRFAHFWNYKRNEYPEITTSKSGMVQTYVDLMIGYVDYFPDDMRLLILNHARKRFSNLPPVDTEE